jgi:hypothetical protein
MEMGNSNGPETHDILNDFGPARCFITQAADVRLTARVTGFLHRDDDIVICLDGRKMANLGSNRA